MKTILILLVLSISTLCLAVDTAPAKPAAKEPAKKEFSEKTKLSLSRIQVHYLAAQSQLQSAQQNLQAAQAEFDKQKAEIDKAATDALKEIGLSDKEWTIDGELNPFEKPKEPVTPVATDKK